MQNLILKRCLEAQLGGFAAGIIFGGLGRIIGGNLEVYLPATPVCLEVTNGGGLSLPGYLIGVGLVHVDEVYPILEKLIGSYLN